MKLWLLDVWIRILSGALWLLLVVVFLIDFIVAASATLGLLLAVFWPAILAGLLTRVSPYLARTASQVIVVGLLVVAAVQLHRFRQAYLTLYGCTEIIVGAARRRITRIDGHYAIREPLDE